MIRFGQYIIEEKGGKNLHLEHLEDSIINDGSKGLFNAIEFVDAIVEMLSGNAGSRYGITVKWDGAPAVFAGVNPENGKFFVGSKSIFNKVPKINYTMADIDANHSGGLAEKLKVALQYLPELGIKGVIQGDMMFTNDLKTQKIGGESYITFTPNTITYAVPVQSDLAKEIARAKIGVVWHTEYKGKKMSDLKASFGVNVKSFKKTANVWFQDAYLRDESGVATFTAGETETAKKLLGDLTRMASKTAYLKIIDTMLTKSTIQMELKTFYNSLVRTGNIGDPHSIYRGFLDFVEQRYDAEISKAKTQASISSKTKAKQDAVNYIKTNSQAIVALFAIHAKLNDTKLFIVRKIEQVKSIGLFLKKDNGFEVTAPEGFVAIDRIGKGAFKLVDRLTFSRANFNAAKNWEKG